MLRNLQRIRGEDRPSVREGIEQKHYAEADREIGGGRPWKSVYDRDDRKRNWMGNDLGNMSQMSL